MRSIRRAWTLVRAIFARPTGGRLQDTSAGTWVTLGNPAVVSLGAIVAFATGAGPVAVANVAGMYYGFDDTCTHRRCSLAEGDLDGTVVTCICHGSQFDVATGAVQRGPAQRPVRSYQVRVEGDYLQIHR